MNKVFRVYVPDPTEGQVTLNGPCVLKVPQYRDSRFLGLAEVAPTRSLLPSFFENTRRVQGYTYMSSEQEPTSSAYVVLAFTDVPFPWPIKEFLGRDIVPEILGVGCSAGVPLLHASIRLAKYTDLETPESDAIFEDELTKVGYAVVATKPYTVGAQLMNVMKANLSRPSSPTEESGVGS